MNALLTDLYQLTMAAGYFEAGKTGETATFELFVRRLPAGRKFLIVAGLEQAVEYLLNLRFTGEEITFLRTLPQFERVRPEFFDYLAQFRFTGDLLAMPEGTPAFAGEPLLTIRAPLAEAQIPETYLLAEVGFQTLVASKAVRVMAAAAGRTVTEMGTRRAHSPESGVLAARAAYLGGCDSTSNVEAGMRYGIPVSGTSAHSWVLSFPTESEAFERLQALLGPGTVYLIDSYDTMRGAQRAASLGKPMWGVRLDSGDLAALSKGVREILDGAGLTDAKIFATGDLNENRIRELVSAGAPIDAFGVGTELATSADAPAIAAVYKLADIESHGVHRPTAKLSAGKTNAPGPKQVYRFVGQDLITRLDETAPEGGQALLEPVIKQGKLVGSLPTLAVSRERCREAVSRLPAALRELQGEADYPVKLSSELESLQAKVQRELRESDTK